jgi:hypothetical protein
MSRRSLYAGQPSDALATIYTSDNVYTTITAATAFNGSGGAETVDIHIVASGGTATDANKVYEALSLADGETKGLQFLVGHTLGRGDTIRAVASTADTVALRLSGDIHG